VPIGHNRAAAKSGNCTVRHRQTGSAGRGISYRTSRGTPGCSLPRPYRQALWVETLIDILHRPVSQIPGRETSTGRNRYSRQLRRNPADLILRLQTASAALTRLPRTEAEGQGCSGWSAPQVPGRRLVSFLVSFMYVYRGPSPSTTALSAGSIDHHDRSWTVIRNTESGRSEPRLAARLARRQRRA